LEAEDKGRSSLNRKGKDEKKKERGVNRGRKGGPEGGWGRNNVEEGCKISEEKQQQTMRMGGITGRMANRGGERQKGILEVGKNTEGVASSG